MVLVDTPGFSHDHMADAEVLNVIADWLKATCVLLLRSKGCPHSVVAPMQLRAEYQANWDPLFPQNLRPLVWNAP